MCQLIFRLCQQDIPKKIPLGSFVHAHAHTFTCSQDNILAYVTFTHNHKHSFKGCSFCFGLELGTNTWNHPIKERKGFCPSDISFMT
jgi:hypothetical protein